MRALITGCYGQDGFYLSKLLVEKGYEVFGFGSDEIFVEDIFDNGPFDEIYNLAAIIDSRTSTENCSDTFLVNTNLAIRMLDLAKETRARFFQASSILQNDLTPYGISKLASHRLTRMYREGGVYAVSGILHNHVSPRSHWSVINKICKASKEGKVVALGNVNSKRDWTHAKDVVKAMWLSLQQPFADDYEICSGESHSIKEVLELTSCRYEIDESFKRNEVLEIKGSPVHAEEFLGWAREYTFQSLIKEIHASVGVEHVGTGRNRGDNGSREVGKLHDGRKDIEFRETIRRIHQL